MIQISCTDALPVAMSSQVWGFFAPQDGPKMPPRRLKTRPRGPQDAPRCPQEGPRRPQDSPRRPQDGPRGPQDAPKTVQDAAKTAQDAPKTPQEAFGVDLGGLGGWKLPPKWTPKRSKNGVGSETLKTLILHNPPTFLVDFCSQLSSQNGRKMLENGFRKGSEIEVGKGAPKMA